MQEIFSQLGELFLGSVPTICFFLFLIGAYAVLVRGPLEKTLRERHARTGGAVEEARKAIAAAEQKTAEYERRLREARAAIESARQARLKQSAEVRERALAETRSAAGSRTQAARQSVEQAGAAAREQILQAAGGLTSEILAAILPHRAAAGQPGGAQ